MRTELDKQVSRIYYEQNREEILRKKKAYYQKNKDKIKPKQNKYYHLTKQLKT